MEETVSRELRSASCVRLRGHGNVRRTRLHPTHSLRMRMREVAKSRRSAAGRGAKPALKTSSDALCVEARQRQLQPGNLRCSFLVVRESHLN